MNTPRAGHSAFGQLCFFSLLALLLLAPLFRSGKTPLAVMVLELIAVFGIALVAWGGKAVHPIRRWEWALIGALLALPLIQLIPLPGLSRLSLPGQGDYHALASIVGDADIVRLSIQPRETWLGLLVLLLPVASYLLVRSLHAPRVMSLVAVLLIYAALQAMLGLIQYASFKDPNALWHLGLAPMQRGTGTYTSPNNFVGLMYCALMLALALFMATLGRHKQRVGKQSLRERLMYFSSWQGHRAFLYGAAALLLLLAVIFTRSRAGIGVTMLGLVLAAIAFARRIGGSNVYGMTGTIITAVLTVGIVIGLGPVLERFSAKDPMSDGRAIIFEDTITGIGQFFPLGSGIGTYRDVFPRFQDLSQAGITINQAHNVYLEWLFTGGVPALLLILALVGVYLVRWLRLQGEWGEFRFVQVGAGLGMLLILLHDTADYNLFVPANMVLFGFLAGVFFHPHVDGPTRQKQRRSKADHSELTRSRLLQPSAAGDADPVANPFMD